MDRRWRPVVVLLLVTTLGTPGYGGTAFDQHAIVAARTVVLEGQDVRVVGDVHSNGTVILRGGTFVGGTAEAGQRVEFDGREARAQRTVSGAPPVALPSVDFAALRRSAARVLAGDQHFRGVNLLPGLTYVSGAVVLEGTVIGMGTLVAERQVTIRNVQFVGIAGVTVAADQRLVVEGTRLNLRGMLQSLDRVDIAGTDMTVRGIVIGGDVRISGVRIEITGDPAVARPGPPAVTPVLSAPTISTPRDRTVFREVGRIAVTGRAAPGARIRITLRSRATQQETATDVAADATGAFRAFVLVPGGAVPGQYVLTVVAMNALGRVSESASVIIFVRAASQ